jgi:hypothetical protein
LSDDDDEEEEEEARETIQRDSSRTVYFLALVVGLEAPEMAKRRHAVLKEMLLLWQN